MKINKIFKKIRHKLTMTTLAVVMACSGFMGYLVSDLSAAAVGNVDIVSTGYSATVSNSSHSNWYVELNRIYGDGRLGFCADPFTYITEAGSGYESSLLSLSDIAYSTLARTAVANDYYNFTNEQVAAFQLYQWEILANSSAWGSGFAINTITGMTIARYEQLKAEFEANTAAFWTKPTFNFSNITIGAGERRTFWVQNGVDVTGWQVAAKSSGLTIEVYPDAIAITNNNTTDATLNFRLEKVVGSYKTASLMYEKVDNQTWTSWGLTDPDGLEFTFSNILEGSFSLHKQDDVTGVGLAGVTFRLESSALGYSQEFTTDSNGDIKVDGLEIGTYTLTEVSTLADYNITMATQNVTITANNTTSLTVGNQYNYGSLELTKKDDVTGANLSGAQFRVTHSDSSVYNQVHTVTNGYLKIDNLPIGAYTVTEVAAPENYNITMTAQNITITSHATSTLNVTNQYKWQEIELIKQDTTYALVDGAVFTIYNDSGWSVDVTVTDGKVTYDRVPLGTFYIKEKSVPAGYLLNTTVYTKSGTSHSTHSQVIVNEEPTGSVTLTKVDSATGAVAQGDATLAGAQYNLIAVTDIYNVSGSKKYYSAGEIVHTFVTDANGNSATKTGLPLGEYKLVETLASNGYNIDPTEYSVNLVYKDQNTKVITNSTTSLEKVIEGRLHITKLASDGSAGLTSTLEGAQFTIKLKSEVDKVGWDAATTYDVITTDSKGEATSKYLPYGTYIVKETYTPDEYYSGNDFTIQIQTEDQYIERYYNNAPFKAWLRLYKVDEAGNYVTLNNATFSLYDENYDLVSVKVSQKYVSEFTTDNNGYVIIDQMLDSGTYYVSEVVTPQGLLTSDDIEVVISSLNSGIEYDSDNEPIISATIINEAPKGKLVLNKLFEEFEQDNEITSAIDVTAYFRLYAETEVISATDGSVIYNVGDEVVNALSEDGTYSLTKGDTLTISDLPLSLEGATYKLVEVASPEGYVLDLEEGTREHTFTIEDQNTTEYSVSFDMDNYLIRTDIFILKTDLYTGEAITGLEGFEFTVYLDEACTQEYTTIKVDPETGIAKLEDVAYGNIFYVKETSTHEDYYLSDEVLKIVVDKNLAGLGTFARFTYANRPIPEIGTQATDINGEKDLDTNVDNTLIDVVDYTNVDITKLHTFVSQLIEKATGEVVL